MSDNFLHRLLTPAGMAEGRAAVTSSYEWFTHARTIGQFDDIKKNGIPLSWPGGYEGVCEITDVLGPEGKAIICLSIFPKRNPLLLNKGGAHLFKMAIHRDDLPSRVGIDLTFGGTYNWAANLHKANPTLSNEDVFLKTVINREVVVTFDVIPAHALRVCTLEKQHEHPSNWPFLQETELEDVLQFAPDFSGYVSV